MNIRVKPEPDIARMKYHGQNIRKVIGLKGRNEPAPSPSLSRGFILKPSSPGRLNLADRPIQNRDLDLSAALFSVFLCILFGANAVAIKISLLGMGPFTIAGLRFSLAAGVIFLWVLAPGRRVRVSRSQFKPILILSLIFAGQLSLFYLGLSRSNASRGTLLANLQPFFTLFLAHYFIPGDQITHRKFFGILLGFSGVAFVFLETKGGSSVDPRMGDCIILVAAFLWAVNAVYIKRVLSRVEPFQVVMYQMTFAAPIFFLEAWAWDPPLAVLPDIKVLGALFYQTVVTAAFGFLAWTYLLQRYGTVALHSFIFIMPIAGVLLGGLILDEPITGKILLALVLIVTGILLVHLKPDRRLPVIRFYKG